MFMLLVVCVMYCVCFCRDEDVGRLVNETRGETTADYQGFDFPNAESVSESQSPQSHVNFPGNTLRVIVRFQDPGSGRFFHIELSETELTVPMGTRNGNRGALAVAAEIRSKQRDPNPKEYSLLRKDTSTCKGFHSTFAAWFSELRSCC